MLRIVRTLCTMGPINRDPAFKLFLDDCSAVAGSRFHRTNIEKALTLFEEENTVPFIARYRRDQTGDIEISDLYELQRKWNDFTSMVKQRTSRLAALEAAGRCDEDIRKAFFECTSKDELDDLYATVKEVKTAKSELIKAFCVESIAADILSGNVKFAMVPPEAAEAARSTKYSVLDAVAYHCTTLISSEIDVKENAKLQFTKHPTVVGTTLTTAYKALAKSMNDSKNGSAKTEGGSSKGSRTAKGESEAKVSELMKYKDYHSVNRRLSQLAAHQLLAIRRGKEAGVLSISLSPDDIAKQNILRFIHNKYQFYPPQDYSPGSTGNKVHRIDVLMLACKEVVSRLCASLTKKQWKEAITSAEVEAAVVFGTSLRPLLLTAPLREVIATQQSALIAPSPSASAATKDSMVVLAVDPGFAHGHKWVVLSPGNAEGAGHVSSGVPAQGESTSIICYGKIFEKSHGGSSKDSHIDSGVSFKSSPVMLHSAAQLGDLLREYRVQVVAIGNGTGSREAQQLVGTAMEHVRKSLSSKNPSSAFSAAAPSAETGTAKEHKESSKRKRAEESSATESGLGTDVAGSSTAAGACVGYVVVSEAGASVYSASERAREEFPPAVLDISYVGAVSIGRRLMDPLSELVKIQPSSLGVGMYQHDLSDKGIAERLRNVVEDCVNVVGVDVNTASADLLRYVSGLNEANVKEIIAHRTVDAASTACSSKPAKALSKSSKSSTTAEVSGAAGRISSLAELRAIKGIGPKTFRNCAGFLRVYGGPEPLDATNIHPEDYELARVMMKVYVQGQKSKAAASDAPVGEKKHKRPKTESGASSAASAENATQSSPEAASFWARYMADSALNKASDSQSALLKSKSVAELEQIWAWVLESGVLATVAPELTPPTARQGADLTSSSAAKGGQPYMSYPKVLQAVPQDFHAAVEVGSVLKGVIRNVTTFGAFVDIGGVVIGSAESGKQGGKGKASCDGLLHCSKYRDFLNKAAASGAHQRTPAAMSAEIYVGREVMVKILTIEETGDGHKASAGSHDKRRISLDLVELL